MEIYLYIYITCFLGLIFYYLYYFYSLKNQEATEAINSEKSISVIICARNEASNLKALIPQLLAQDFVNYEIIVVDHDSADNTENLLKKICRESEKLKYLKLKFDEYPGKKHALKEGIKKAKNEFLVLTDADCRVKSIDWLKLYSQYFQNKEIVLGYGPYQKEKGFLNSFIRFDTFLIAIQYLSFAKKGSPYMGVGRNLGYKKKTFIENNGFESHLELKSGDDDLFIQEVANRNNTSIGLNKKHFTESIPCRRWRDFFKQKKRHLTTGTRYKISSKILLITYPIFVFLFSILFLVFLFKSSNLILIIGLYLLKIFIQWNVFKKISKTLGEKDLWIISPILELMTVIYNGIVALSLFASKNIEWK